MMMHTGDASNDTRPLTPTPTPTGQMGRFLILDKTTVNRTLPFMKVIRKGCISFDERLKNVHHNLWACLRRKTEKDHLPSKL